MAEKRALAAIESRRGPLLIPRALPGQGFCLGIDGATGVHAACPVNLWKAVRALLFFEPLIEEHDSGAASVAYRCNISDKDGDITRKVVMVFTIEKECVVSSTYDHSTRSLTPLPAALFLSQPV